MALQERLAISGAELRLLVLRVPSVLTSDLDATIWPKVDFLQQELSLDGTGAAQLLLKAPSLLSGSLDASLRPNLEVWRTQLAREGLDAREVFVREPSRALVLSLSNERRTVPRFERGRAAGATAASMHSAMRLSDAKFDAWIASRRGGKRQPRRRSRLEECRMSAADDAPEAGGSSARWRRGWAARASGGAR